MGCRGRQYHGWSTFPTGRNGQQPTAVSRCALRVRLAIATPHCQTAFRNAVWCLVWRRGRMQTSGSRMSGAFFNTGRQPRVTWRPSPPTTGWILILSALCFGTRGHCGLRTPRGWGGCGAKLVPGTLSALPNPLLRTARFTHWPAVGRVNCGLPVRRDYCWWRRGGASRQLRSRMAFSATTCLE